MSFRYACDSDLNTLFIQQSGGFQPRGDSRVAEEIQYKENLSSSFNFLRDLRAAQFPEELTYEFFLRRGKKATSTIGRNWTGPRWPLSWTAEKIIPKYTRPLSRMSIFPETILSVSP